MEAKSDKPPLFTVPPSLDKPPELREKKSDEIPVWRVPIFFPPPFGPTLIARGCFEALRLAAARPILCFTKTKWVQE